MMPNVCGAGSALGAGVGVVVAATCERGAAGFAVADFVVVDLGVVAGLLTGGFDATGLLATGAGRIGAVSIGVGSVVCGFVALDGSDVASIGGTLARAVVGFLAHGPNRIAPNATAARRISPMIQPIQPSDRAERSSSDNFSRSRGDNPGPTKFGVRSSTGAACERPG